MRATVALDDEVLADTSVWIDYIRRPNLEFAQALRDERTRLWTLDRKLHKVAKALDMAVMNKNPL